MLFDRGLMLRRHRFFWAVLFFAALLGGCATTTALPGPDADPVAAGAAQTAATAASIPAPAPAARPQMLPTPEPAEPVRAARRDNTAEQITWMLGYADRLRSMSAPELMAEIARLGDMPEAQRNPTGDLQLALALGQTHSPTDVPRALALVQKVLSNPREEARSLQPLARLLAARYTDQRRAEEQVERQNQQLRDGQRRIDQLNERLEAVRAIERSMTARPSASGASSATGSRPNP